MDNQLYLLQHHQSQVVLIYGLQEGQQLKVLLLRQVITLTGGANLPNGTYTWTAGGQTTQAINVNPQTTNAYSMVYNLNGCVDTIQYTVNVNPKPLITVNDASICAGSSTILTAAGTPLGGTYSWTGGATTNSITVSPTSTTNYIVTYTQNGCSASDTALVQVTNTPTISLTPVNPTICSGSSVLLTATPINSPLTGVGITVTNEVSE